MRISGSRREKVTGEWRRFHSEKLYTFYSSPVIIKHIKEVEIIRRRAYGRTEIHVNIDRDREEKRRKMGGKRKEKRRREEKRRRRRRRRRREEKRREEKRREEGKNREEKRRREEKKKGRGREENI
jgi:hypothetical protein